MAINGRDIVLGRMLQALPVFDRVELHDSGLIAAQELKNAVRTFDINNSNSEEPNLEEPNLEEPNSQYSNGRGRKREQSSSSPSTSSKEPNKSDGSDKSNDSDQSDNSDRSRHSLDVRQTRDGTEFGISVRHLYADNAQSIRTDSPYYKRLQKVVKKGSSVSITSSGLRRNEQNNVRESAWSGRGRGGTTRYQNQIRGIAQWQYQPGPRQQEDEYKEEFEYEEEGGSEEEEEVEEESIHDGKFIME